MLPGTAQLKRPSTVLTLTRHSLPLRHNVIAAVASLFSLIGYKEVCI